MIVVDTNVICEMMRVQPDPTVLEWVETSGRLYTSAVTLAEIEYGIARLPSGRRRDQLARGAAEIFADFRECILAFDARAARRYAEVVTGREAIGRPISFADAQIAATCAAHHASLATRNVVDFSSTGIDLVNPWIPRD